MLLVWTAIWSTVGVLSWLALRVAWLPAYPVCLPTGRERLSASGLLYAITEYQALGGPLRPEFERIFGGAIYDARITADGIYVTPEYYLDPNLAWNFTMRTLRELVGNEVFDFKRLGGKINPQFYDADGNFRKKDFDKLNETYGYVGGFEFNNLNCEVFRFFAIEGAPPPRNRVFEVRYEGEKRSKVEKILNYFIEKFDR